MKTKKKKSQHDQPALTIARHDFAAINEESTVGEALEGLRAGGIGERIIYFYVTDDKGKMTGVVPVRRMLTAPLDTKIAEVMIKKTIKLREDVTILEAYEAMNERKLLALPIVDGNGRIKGVVDAGMFSDGPPDHLDKGTIDEIFKIIGVHVSEARDVSPATVFRRRFPWLVATIISGTTCALLASVFDATLAASLVLAFFLTLVLGLGESVSMQSMTVAIHALRTVKPNAGWYFRSLAREAGSALLLGVVCGSVVGSIVWAWRGDGVAAVSIGASILAVIVIDNAWGLTIPTLLHLFRVDPKIAAGPVTLAVSDICTILIYFTIAMFLLGRHPPAGTG